MQKKISHTRKILLPGILFFLCLSTLFFSCGRSIYSYSAYFEKSIFKGKMKDGAALYFMQDDSKSNAKGHIFISRNEAVVNLIPYEYDADGTIYFWLEENMYKGKIKIVKRKKEMQLHMPQIASLGVPKQQVLLYYADADREKPHCQELWQRKTYDSILVYKDIQYGEAPGHYVTFPVNDSLAVGDTLGYGKEIAKVIFKTLWSKNDLPLLMDIYMPYDPDSVPKPVFMFMHGGGFFIGDKGNHMQRGLTDDLVKKGYAVISINYRMGSAISGVKSVEKMIYAGVQDARAALRYITHHSKELGINPNQIYICGTSAGAIITLNTAFMDDDEVFKSAARSDAQRELGGLNTSGNALRNSYSIAGIIPMWGAVVDLDIIDGRNADIPVLLFHGTTDNMIPIDSGLPLQNELSWGIYDRLAERWQLYGSRSIYNHMKKMNMPVRLFSFEGYKHEPQKNQDGSFNENMLVIKREIDNFLYRKENDQLRIHSIAGDSELYPNDEIPVYKIENAENLRRIQWYVEGGMIVGRTGNAIKVVWFSGNKSGKVYACITDEWGMAENVELLVKIHP